MTKEKQTLGQAIDEIVASLEPLESAARATALGAVCAHLQIDFGPARSGTPTAPTSAGQPALPITPPPVSTPPAAQVDIRSLKDSKTPKTARQMACVVAYYLQELAPEADRKETISTADLEKYFKQAGFKLPEKITQVLVDAKGAGYFDSAKRGEYKLNAVGYNLVAHNLPEGSA